MKYLCSILCGLMMIACNQSDVAQNKIKQEEMSKPPTYKVTGSIERLDPRINQLISENAVIEVLADGFTWAEGPVWIEDEQYLLFSDIPPNRIMKWSEKDGISLYLATSGYTGTTPRKGESGSNGLILDQNRNLVLCQHGDRRMARMTATLNEPKPIFQTIIDNYEGKRFNSPNDAVYDSRENLYFTDPPYGLEGNMEDPSKEIDFQGIYRYSNEGALSLLSNQVTRPNGIGFSPDEKTLYVSSSDPKKAVWMAYSLDNNGKVIKEKIFYDATDMVGKTKGLPDGLKVDKKGNIWATGPGGVWVFNNNGELLGKILTGEATSNCAFDTNQTTLYMTCDDYLMRIKLK